MQSLYAYRGFATLLALSLATPAAAQSGATIDQGEALAIDAKLYAASYA